MSRIQLSRARRQVRGVKTASPSGEERRHGQAMKEVKEERI